MSMKPLPVLIVEDDAALREALRDTLELSGYRVIEASDGKHALEALGVWKSVERRVARAENVRAAFVLVARGEVPFGIVYATDALADRSVRIVDTFPEDTHPPIVYPAAVPATSQSTAARALLDYLKSPAARSVWEQYGFAAAR